MAEGTKTVNDVSNLMGKLKANVAYRQFNDYGSDVGSPTPALKAALTRPEPRPLAADAEPVAPLVVAATGVSQIETAPTEAKTADAIAGVLVPPPEGSILRRYSAPTPSAQPSRALVDIFAYLQSKAR